MEPRTVAQQKHELRQHAATRRETLHASAAKAAEGAAAVFLDRFALTAGTVVSGYWPMGSELDPRPLMERLHTLGCDVALPVTQGRDLPLLFRAWEPGAPLQSGGFGTSIPATDATVRCPSLLLVPLLAVDKDGYRLGYGGGYYDRTLRALRGSGRPVTAVGFAFAGQRVEELPRHDGDEALDWLVSETGTQRFQ